MNAHALARGLPIAAGGVTALLLGVYGAAHDPTGRSFAVAGFTDVAAWKSALATVTLTLFIVQLFVGARMTGRFGPHRPTPPWLADLHRIVGTLAFGVSLPVAFHCLWALGYQSSSATVLTHSLLGCVAYGLYTAKVLTVRRDTGPAWAAPALGALLGGSVLALWWSSALLHYTS